MDEKSFQRRHEYVTTVCDLDRGHVLYVGDHRKQKTLETIYQQLAPEQLEGIEAVAMDMWDPYVAATQNYVPRAEEKIVSDPVPLPPYQGTKLECPSSLLIVSKSTPASSMPVAQEWRIVWGVAAFWIPALARASLYAF